jgi:hypothetical protein
MSKFHFIFFSNHFNKIIIVVDAWRIYLFKHSATEQSVLIRSYRKEWLILLLNQNKKKERTSIELIPSLWNFQSEDRSFHWSVFASGSKGEDSESWLVQFLFIMQHILILVVDWDGEICYYINKQSIAHVF